MRGRVCDAVLLLGALAALTYWLNAQVHVDEPSFDGSGRHDPDVFIEDFKAVNLDQDGRIRQALTAHRAEHYPDNSTMSFVSPAITFTDPDKPKLDVTADRALVTDDRAHVYFDGHVKAVREAEAGPNEKPEGPITVTSEFLHVIPGEERVVTDRAVTITDPRGTVSGVGLSLDNRAKTAELESHVSGQMQPQTIRR